MENPIAGREVLASDPTRGVSIVRQLPDTAYYIFLEGQIIPHVQVLLDDAKDEISVLVDGRMAWSVTREALFAMAPVLANAMAVAAGFSSFGVNSRQLNPYRKYGAPNSAGGLGDWA
jgi:hypothetical protein